jgi:hypothetical protein
MALGSLCLALLLFELGNRKYGIPWLIGTNNCAGTNVYQLKQNSLRIYYQQFDKQPSSQLKTDFVSTMQNPILCEKETTKS